MPYALHDDVPSDEQFYRRVTAEIGDEEPKGLGLRDLRCRTWTSPMSRDS